MNTAHLSNALNLALCFAWGWSAMARLAAMHGGVKWKVKILYLCLFVASFFDGLQFYVFGTLADWPDVLASTLLLALLWTTIADWRNGVPSCARRV